MPVTRYVQKAFLDHAFLGGTAKYKQMPATKQLYAGLLTPNKEGRLIEVTGAGYSRVPLKLAESPVENRYANDSTLTFTAGELWPVISDFGIWDAPVGGHLLAFNALRGGGVRLGENDKLTVAVGDLVVGGTA